MEPAHITCPSSHADKGEDVDPFSLSQTTDKVPFGYIEARKYDVVHQPPRTVPHGTATLQRLNEVYEPVPLWDTDAMRRQYVHFQHFSPFVKFMSASGGNGL